jgi:hypothetical protein
MDNFKIEEEEEWVLPRGEAEKLLIDTPDGSIRVTAAGSGDLQVRVRKVARAADEAAARELLSRIKAEGRLEDGAWALRAEWPPSPSGESRAWASVRFEATVPAGLFLEARSGDGRIEATGLAGVLLRTSDGSIQVSECAGPVDAESGDGSVKVLKAGGKVEVVTGDGGIEVTEAGEIRLRTGDGAISAKGCAGPVEAVTGDGSIRISATRGPILARTGDGSIEAEVADPSPEIELKTGDGRIVLRAPKATSARLAARTGDGRITVDPALSPLSGGDRKTRALETVLGAGEGSIRLRTGDGDVRVGLAEAVA